MTDLSNLTEAKVLALDIKAIKSLALDLGFHVTAVEDGYRVSREDEIETGLEGTDLDTSFVTKTEDEAYEAIRHAIATMADMSAWIDARRKARRGH